MLAGLQTSNDLARLDDPRLFREQAYIGGRWSAAESAAVLSVTNPATQTVLGHVPNMGARETRAAIEAAAKAYPAWRSLLPQERCRMLKAWHALILENLEDLALLLTLEQGKPLAEARGEIDYAASFVEWFAEEGKRLNVESITPHLPNRQMTVRRVPVGVTAAVTPWNFPSAMITRKAAAALAAGCPMVVRPASETPFSALALAELAERAGLPAGVLSVVTGDPKPIVGTLCKDHRVRAVSFTGSTEIGRRLLAKGAATVKRMLMELGGHAPFILFPDTALDTAVSAALDAKFQTTGQDCLAANRIYVHESHHEAFCADFAKAAACLKVGNGLEAGVRIGPLMHERAVAKCDSHVRDAIEKGARLLTGGKRHRLGGLFYEPTVLSDVRKDMLIAQEETFGPVAAILKFSNEAEVIRQANATDYGLAAYLWTHDRQRVARLCEALEFGMVAVNCVKMTGAPVPFGGVKQSGLGREGSRQGLEAFTELKYVCADAPALL